MNALHCVLHVELVLECKRDRRRVADDQQVVGHIPRAGRAGAGTVASQELLLRLAGVVAARAAELLVVALVSLRCLGSPVPPLQLVEQLLVQLLALRDRGDPRRRQRRRQVIPAGAVNAVEGQIPGAAPRSRCRPTANVQ